MSNVLNERVEDLSSGVPIAMSVHVLGQMRLELRILHAVHRLELSLDMAPKILKDKMLDNRQIHTYHT